MSKRGRKRNSDGKPVTRRSEPMEIDLQNNEPCGSGGMNGDNDDLDHISDDEEGGMRIGGIYIPPPPKPALTFDATGPRLIISNIVIENFKSYSGKRILGPFHKSFTSIIGPNGSGKSNVLDAMLFVFGYRAIKLRSKKLAGLIHDSASVSNINKATVEVHFYQIIDEENDGFTVVPDTNIVVSRTCFKDNTSHYCLNGKKVHFKEVAKVLRSFQIDLDHNRFLILQGEVELIALMKSKGLTDNEVGLLEYLEDIIGTSRYKVPIEKLNEKVEEYTELRKEKLNRVRLVEAEKQKLEIPMMDTIEKINQINTALRTKNSLLQKRIFEANKVIEVKGGELDILKGKLDEIDGKINEKQTLLKDKTRELDEGSQRYSDLKRKKESVSEKIQSIKREVTSIQTDTAYANKKKKNLDQSLTQDKNKLIELEMIPEKNNRNISECKTLLERHEREKTQADEEFQNSLAGMRSQTQELQVKKDALEAKLMELHKVVDDAQSEFKLIETEANIYGRNQGKEVNTLEQYKEEFDSLNKKIEENTKKTNELPQLILNSEREILESKKRLQELKNSEEKIISEMRRVRGPLEESKQAMRATKSQGAMLGSLMEQKRSGHLPGIYGRMGDLGAIDAKYDVAISTCCGGLDYILVDTVDTGQACVEYLKKNNLGTSNFLCLDKQQRYKSEMGRKRTFPENVPRLFDLIRVTDERVLPAFYFLLRNTLVADTIDQAARIAATPERHRVVDLKGNVYESSGTLSGGGDRVIRGKMGSSVKQNTSEQHEPKYIQQQEKKLAALENKLSEIRSEISPIEESLYTMQRSLDENKSALINIKSQLEHLKPRVPSIREQISRQELKVSQCKVDERKKAQLEMKLEAARKKVEEAKQKTGAIEVKVADVDKEIAAVAGGKINALRTKVDSLDKKIDKVTREITKFQVEINTSVRNAGRVKEKINQMEKDLKETETNLDQLKESKKSKTLENTKLEKELEELEIKMKEGSGEFSGLKKEIGKLTSKVNTLKTEKLEINNETNKMKASIKDVEDTIPRYRREIASITLEDPGPGTETIPGVERPPPLVTYTDEELSEIDLAELKARYKVQQGRVPETKPDLKSIMDYKQKEEVYLRRAQELEDITTQRNEMRTLYDQLKKRRVTDFLAGFNSITAKLKEMYQMITLGGDAELDFVDSLDPFTEGINLNIRPPNKSWKAIANLSGGEKTLASLALVFALHYYKPSPLYVMDEIDAALDFKNISIVANYIKNRTKNAQFIVISLRYNMFELSNRLIGIYKTNNCTKSITIENTEEIGSEGESK